MPTTSACPDGQNLEQFLLGHIPDDQTAALEQHLLECDQCAAALNQLVEQDALVRPLQAQAAATQETASEAVESLMRRLSEQPPPGLAVATQTPDTAETPTNTPSDEYDFLNPPQGPEELGRLGPYRILKVLGTGGMGVVFEAEDLHLQRAVALKVIRPALAASAQARQRFRREAQAAAGIQHDHIVTIYQEGEDRGVPFLAMELLEGESLEDRLKRDGCLPMAEVLRIAGEIAEGLAAAHDRGLMHRDIKPGNIWLETLRGERGESAPGYRVKILDFGLARAIASDVSLTQSGVIAGTPQYMAPEQAEGTAVDARCDLFSLGCVLYRMATGEVPFKGASTMAILRSVELKQPQPLQELNPAVPAALAELILQLLGKLPGDRPASARAVVEAISAISMLSPGAAFAGRPRTKARNRKLWALAAAAVLLMGLGLAGYWFGPAVIRIATNKGELVIKTEDPDVEVAIRQNGELVEIIDLKTKQKIELRAGEYEVALKAKAEGLRLSADKFTLKRGSTQIITVERQETVATRHSWDEVRRLVSSGEHVEAAKAAAQLPPILPDSWDGYRWTTDFLARGARLAEQETKLSSGQRQFAVQTYLHRAKQLLQEAGTRWADDPSIPNDLAWYLATCGDVRLRDPKQAVALAQRAVQLAADKGTCWDTLGVAHYRAGNWQAALAALEKSMQLRNGGDGFDWFFLAMAHWQLGDKGKARQCYDRANAWTANNNPRDTEVQCFRIEAGNLLGLFRVLRSFTGHVNAVHGVAASPDGRRALSASFDGSVRLWDVQTGLELRRFLGHQSWVTNVAFSPDGHRAVSSSMDTTLRLWDVKTGQALRPFVGHTGPVEFVVFSPDGRRVLSGADDKTMRLWDAETGKELRRFEGHADTVRCVAFSPDGRHALSSSFDKTMRLWDVETGQELRRFLGHTSLVVNGMFTPDGRHILSCSEDKTVRSWDVETAQELRCFRGHTGPVQCLTLSGDGRRALSAGNDGTARLWDVETGRQLYRFEGHTRAIWGAVLLQDGRHALTGGHEDFSLLLWELPPEKEKEKPHAKAPGR